MLILKCTVSSTIRYKISITRRRREQRVRKEAIRALAFMQTGYPCHDEGGEMISRIVEAIDNIPYKALLGVNLAIGIFVLLAHGGSLALSLSKNQAVPVLVLSTLPAALFLILTCIIGFLSEKQRLRILSIHAFILACGAILLLCYGLSLLLKGFPEGTFTWGLGLFTLFCAYPVYLIRRTVLRGFITKSMIIKYLCIPIFVIALCVDFAVFIKAATHFNNYQQELFQKFKVK